MVYDGRKRGGQYVCQNIRLSPSPQKPHDGESIASPPQSGGASTKYEAASANDPKSNGATSLSSSQSSTSSGNTTYSRIYADRAKAGPRVPRDIRFRPQLQKLRDEESVPGPPQYNGASTEDEHAPPFIPETGEGAPDEDSLNILA